MSAPPAAAEKQPPGAVAAVQRCTAALNAYAARLEARTEERRRRLKAGADDDAPEAPGAGPPREPGFARGEGALVRYAMVPVVVVLVGWVYGVFAARICVPAFRRTGQALAPRSTGIGLLVAATILTLLTLWSYLRILVTPPGYVREHVGVSDTPEPAADEYYYPAPWAPAGARHFGGEPAAPASVPLDAPLAAPPAASASPAAHAGDASAPAIAAVPQEVPEAPEAPALPALVGPLGAAALQPSAPVVAVPAASGETPTWSGLIPRPSRMPAAKPVLAPAHRYCHRCMRVRPPRAHHCRRCGTCVMRMDHHCPWIGGCVGAQNHKFYYNFVFWVTAFELFVMVSSAVLFARGVRGAAPYAAWRTDGFVISVFALTAVFTLFTLSLLLTHTYLLHLNLTTLEHMAVERAAGAERAAMDGYFSSAGAGGAGMHLRERRALRNEWDAKWGAPKRQGNLWWIDRRAKPAEGPTSNWRSVMGESALGWILPIGKAPLDGTWFPTNPRHSRLGVQRPREMWPDELRAR